MSLYKAMQSLKFDKRLSERNITTGQMSRDEWDKHLKDLPDMGHNVDTLDMENADDDNGDQDAH